MAFIEWSNQLSVGVEEMDMQHKQWVAIINELHEAMKTGKTSIVMADVLKKMSDYVVYHFSQEEKLLNSNGFTDLINHKSIHDRYSVSIKKLVNEFSSGKVLISLEIMNSLKDWLTSHIMVQDKKYGEFFQKKSAR